MPRVMANKTMIDGRANNRPKEVRTQAFPKVEKEAVKQSLPDKKPVQKQASAPGKRRSVLQRLREKQEEVAVRYGKKAPEQAKDDMERNRK